jgi:hypothetical protein
VRTSSAPFKPLLTPESVYRISKLPKEVSPFNGILQIGSYLLIGFAVSDKLAMALKLNYPNFSSFRIITALAVVSQIRWVSLHLIATG